MHRLGTTPLTFVEHLETRNEEPPCEVRLTSSQLELALLRQKIWFLYIIIILLLFAFGAILYLKK